MKDNWVNCQLPREGEGRGWGVADSTDCLIFGRGLQRQIVICSPEIKTDSLTVCLSGILNVTDRWVITVSQSWQAVEMKEWRCGTRGWNRGADRRRESRKKTPARFLPYTGQTENEFVTLSSYSVEYFMPKEERSLQRVHLCIAVTFLLSRKSLAGKGCYIMYHRVHTSLRANISIKCSEEVELNQLRVFTHS